MTETILVQYMARILGYLESTATPEQRRVVGQIKSDFKKDCAAPVENSPATLAPQPLKPDNLK